MSTVYTNGSWKNVIANFTFGSTDSPSKKDRLIDGMMAFRKLIRWHLIHALQLNSLNIIGYVQCLNYIYNGGQIMRNNEHNVYKRVYVFKLKQPLLPDIT